MATKKPSRGGRPCHAPTKELRAIASMAAAIGIPHHDLARVMQMSTHTLLKHYREELDLGKTTATLQVGGALYNAALRGNTTAQIFWMKAQAGWREVAVHEHTGAGGTAIQHAVTSKHISEDDALKTYLWMVTTPGVTGHA